MMFCQMYISVVNTNEGICNVSTQPYFTRSKRNNAALVKQTVTHKETDEEVWVAASLEGKQPIRCCSSYRLRDNLQRMRYNEQLPHAQICTRKPLSCCVQEIVLRHGREILTGGRISSRKNYELWHIRRVRSGQYVGKDSCPNVYS